MGCTDCGSEREGQYGLCPPCLNSMGGKIEEETEEDAQEDEQDGQQTLGQFT